MGSIWGCLARINVVPEIAQKPDEIQVLLRGSLSYEGNPDYLPRTVADYVGSASAIAIRYSYEDVQGRSPLVNKFTLTHSGLLFEQPVGFKSVRVIGSLDVLDGERVVKTYSAMATLSAHSEYSRETLSDMRRRGLLAVRDNVESQMYQDREFLQRLTARQAQPANQ